MGKLSEVSEGNKENGGRINGAYRRCHWASIFIPDDSPDYLKGWSFGFYFRSSSETIIKIEEVKKDG